jgi:hypothetical protein
VYRDTATEKVFCNKTLLFKRVNIPKTIFPRPSDIRPFKIDVLFQNIETSEILRSSAMVDWIAGTSFNEEAEE